ncbi:signal recognition particle-docking protein FtsY [Chenggangzhangella methanolivorans]|uniref:Signal recognition particle receptor FtsY n=1 Tax=Chenggangzhangella methanolivorans TaxID=1437009 RepID=A0A9E6RIP0_9HYPH|nr:signal recognition particle-docking protein FtsY [Chenggangzhangella methanolivorans]QZO02181.1 signal recognition particle-docking protein FtsY [Chenggangzhangella methanolivorans]
MTDTTETGWFARLKAGLSKTSSQLTRGITELFTKEKFDATTLDELEDLLIQADLGLATAERVVEAVGRARHTKALDGESVRQIVAQEVAKALEPVARPFDPPESARPAVLLVVGVNGAGKTTTIGKIAETFRTAGLKIVLAAGDTFRAAAVEQLGVWAQRSGAIFVAKETGADAAALVYEAWQKAKAEDADLLIVDTAGRLQNKAGLMAELEKIVRVLKKLDPEAPHDSVLVLDATTGQNAIGQVEAFGKVAGITGLVMTKLDGTARGGILVAVAERFKLPVHFIGVGEGLDDLEPFDPDAFARAIVGLPRE